MDQHAEGIWTVVLPVKGGPTAKSRLRGPVGLALAIATDCLAAVVSTSAVGRALVITADPTVASAARDLGAETMVQPRDEPGLNRAIEIGVRSARGPVAVLLADLAALRSRDLGTALGAAAAAFARGAAVVMVPDGDATGTVLLAAADPAALRPSFGPGSAARHAAGGAFVLDLDLPRLRRDVDTQSDLTAALALGVGPRTAAIVAAVQATVLRYDAPTRTGDVVTDEGVRLRMESGALDGSGLRHLRPGQRVTCVRASPQSVTTVRILGIATDEATQHPRQDG